MIRTSSAVLILIGVVIWLPVWAQITFFALAVAVLRYQVLLLIPAILADVLYAPMSSLSIHHLLMTSIVSGLLLVSFIIRTQTRLSS